MAKKPRVNAYEQLVKRIREVITAPPVQRRRQVTIARQAGESVDDWDRLLDEMDTAEELTITRNDDGSVSLRWKKPEEDS